MRGSVARPPEVAVGPPCAPFCASAREGGTAALECAWPRLPALFPFAPPSGRQETR